MDNIITIKNLSKNFKNITAIDDLSLDIKKGRVLGVLGANGSGKSTLLKLIVGLLKTDAGEILIDGKKPSIKSRSQISYLPDSYNLFDDLSVDETINMYEDFYPDFNRKICISMIDFLKIPHRNKCGSLSKGLKERLLLVLCLSRDSEIYILDEPVDGVDPVAKEAVSDLLIDRIQTGRSFIITTHQISHMENLFDDVIFLDQGKLLKAGSAIEIRNSVGSSLDDFYKRINNLI